MGIFGIFKKNKIADQQTEQINHQSNSKINKKGLHVKNQRKTLIGQMKLAESLPSTIEDSLNGDKSILNTEADYFIEPKLKFNDGVWYPMFIIDEDTLIKAGAKEKIHRNELGNLSRGLKTASGATGLISVITETSLSQGYIGVLCNNDALISLNAWSLFSDYKPGWLVGLCRVKGGKLQVKTTELRLPMTRWLEFGRREVKMSVVNNELELHTDAQVTASPFEHQGKIRTDDKNETPKNSIGGTQVKTHGVDSSDLPPVKSVKPNTTKTTKVEPKTDLGVTDKDESGSINSDVDSNESSDESEVKDAADKQVKSVKDLVKNPNVQLNSADEAEAAVIGERASVRTLSDFNISISDREFVDAYVNNITVALFPLVDESNDPTGYKHQQNVRRNNYNQRLLDLVAARKAKARSWFQDSRSQLLEGIKTGTDKLESRTKKYRTEIEQLKTELNDPQVLAGKAASELDDEFSDMASQEAELRTLREQQVAAELAAQNKEFDAKFEARKKDLVNQRVNEIEQRYIRQLNEYKVKIKELVQKAASETYGQIMDEARDEYENSMRILNNHVEKFSKDLAKEDADAREADNQRITDESNLAKTKVEIEKLEAKLESALKDKKTIEAESKRRLKDQKAKQALVVDDTLKVLREERDAKVQLKQQYEADIQKLKDERSNAIAAAVKDRDDRVATIQGETSKELQQLHNIQKHFKSWLIVGFLLALIVGIGVGFVIKAMI